jgi:hypothetical protein
MRIQVELDQAHLAAALRGQQRQVDYAIAVALTKTAKEIQKAMPAELDQIFDRPTPFTKRGTYLQSAKRDNLVAVVGFKSIQAKYLQRQTEDNTYIPGEAGIKLPGNIQLNAFGNIPRGIIDKLKAAAQNGDLSAAIAKRLNANGNRRKGAKPIQLFFGKPKGAGWEDAPLGIWRRVPGVSGGPGKLIPVIVFEDTPAKYKKKLDMEDIGRPLVQRHFKRLLDEAVRHALSTAR